MSGLQVPYTHPVSLSTGSSMTIKGKPVVCFSLDPELQVDLHTGTDEKSGIAFHFRVYFGRGVVMNSRDCGGWQYEMKSSHMPFEDGKPFELCISVLQNEYQVMVNGKHWYSFPHRVNPESVKMMQVWRDVNLTSVCV